MWFFWILALTNSKWDNENKVTWYLITYPTSNSNYNMELFCTKDVRKSVKIVMCGCKFCLECARIMGFKQQKIEKYSHLDHNLNRCILTYPSVYLTLGKTKQNLNLNFEFWQICYFSLNIRSPAKSGIQIRYWTKFWFPLSILWIGIAA